MNVNFKKRQKLRELVHGFEFSCSLFAMVRLGIADILAKGPKKVEELAKQSHTDLSALRRLINFMTPLGVMENKNEEVNLTETGKFLVSNHPESLACEVAMFAGEEMYQAWGNILYSLQTGSPAFDKIYGRSMFEYFKDNKDTAARFHAGWQEITIVTVKEFVKVYKFSDQDSILDVGSGYGVFLCTIFKENPKLRKGALYDLPVSLEGAPIVIKNHGLENKISVIPGDAKKSVPTSYNVYLLKSVIHLCDDEQSIQILRNCAEALENNAKILIIERIVPVNIEIPINKELHWGRVIDMTMLVMADGKERTKQELSILCEKSGLRVTKTIELPSGLSVIECKKK